MSVRRDNGVKAPLALSDLTTTIPKLLDTIHNDMLERARKTYNESVVKVEEWKELVPTLNQNKVVVLPWCEVEKCEDEIKKRSAEE